MNLPNILTLSRIFLAMILGSFAQVKGVSGALVTLVVFVAAAVTDLFDGQLARKYNLITTFGKIMDPIADKCLTLTAFFIFAFEGEISIWMVLLVAAREILVTAWRIYAVTRNQVLPAESAGKIKTFFQMLTICCILVYRVFWSWPPSQALLEKQLILIVVVVNTFMIIATILTLWSGWKFFERLRIE